MEPNKKGIEEIVGIVEHGESRGKELGFPTANIHASAQSPDGVYISITMVQQQPFPSLTFIGSAETFNQTTRRIETYILDFHQELYGQELRVRLLQKIRNSEKFSSVDDLIAAMQRDEQQARTYFGLTQV